uniref:Zinc finger CCCH domain-containing protein 13-like n=1 Tax=Steinernema glaseri TaxID=37863 RepID=A0A1I7Z5N3_9BILA
MPRRPQLRKKAFDLFFPGGQRNSKRRAQGDHVDGDEQTMCRRDGQGRGGTPPRQGYRRRSARPQSEDGPEMSPECSNSRLATSGEQRQARTEERDSRSEREERAIHARDSYALREDEGRRCGLLRTRRHALMQENPKFPRESQENPNKEACPDARESQASNSDYSFSATTPNFPKDNSYLSTLKMQFLRCKATAQGTKRCHSPYPT